MSTIQSRTPEKKAKNHARLTCKSPWNSCSTAHLPFLSPNPKILKAFLKTLPTKMKLSKCPAREKKMRQEKQEVKVKTAVSKFCFLRMPELRKVIFCIWIRRPWSVRPVNRSLTRKPLEKLQNAFFGKISGSKWVKTTRRQRTSVSYLSLCRSYSIKIVKFCFRAISLM